MAIWQFTLHLLPQPVLADRFGEIPVRLDQDLWYAEEIDWWAGHALCADHEARLDAVLPRMLGHWSRSTTAWGAYDGDIVEISREAGALESVYVRLNLAHPDPAYWRAVCELGHASDCWLVTEDMMLIEARIELLLREVEQSGAARFLSDPHGFFDSFQGMPPLG